MKENEWTSAIGRSIRKRSEFGIVTWGIHRIGIGCLCKHRIAPENSRGRASSLGDARVPRFSRCGRERPGGSSGRSAECLIKQQSLVALLARHASSQPGAGDRPAKSPAVAGRSRFDTPPEALVVLSRRLDREAFASARSVSASPAPGPSRTATLSLA